MSLAVYFRDDLARMLRSISLVAAASLSSPAEARGFALAVRAIGEAIGVNVMHELVVIEQGAHPLEEAAVACRLSGGKVGSGHGGKKSNEEVQHQLAVNPGEGLKLDSVDTP